MPDASVCGSHARRFDSDWVMIFTVRNGKVVHFREFADVAAINAAYE